MSQENPANLIRSWNLMSGWNTGPVREDKLTPVKYGRLRTLFNHTWREEQISSNFDWGSQNFSVYLPESLYVVGSIYLKIELPVNNSGNYKDFPGIFALKQLRIMSNGTEVYTADCNLFFHDYLESLSDEALRVFSETYLGKKSAASGAARTVMIPIMLPNSAYMGRADGTSHSHGIFPCFLGQSRLELQLTMNPATFVAADAANAPGSIAGACSLMYHQVELAENKRGSYADLRGNYSIINRRFTELTSGWTHCAGAGSANEQHVNQYQPQGTVTEILIIAVADDADDSRHDVAYIMPDSLKITADSIVQKDLDTPQKVRAELWTNGYVPNATFTSPGRLCFAAHCSTTDHVFSGGYNMQLASNVDIAFTFPSACRYKVVASQIQRVSIDAVGKIRARLE